MNFSSDKLERVSEWLSSQIGSFYFVGGVVRDLISGRDGSPGDLDVITPADVSDISSAFEHGNFINKDHDTYSVPFRAGKERIDVEITSIPAGRIEDDLLSRDLTINSVAVHVTEESGFSWQNVRDPCGGREDIRFRVLRCYRKENLAADPLRLLRIFRFQSVFGFDIEPNTFFWIRDLRETIHRVAAERLYKELILLLSSQNRVNAIREMAKSGLLQELMPLINESVTFLHSDRHHNGESVLEHSLRVMEQLELNADTGLIALFHDTGKPFVFDGKHYIGHEKKSVELTEKTLDSLKFPKKQQRRVCDAIKWHMIPLNSLGVMREMAYHLGRERFEEEIKFVVADKLSHKKGWKETAQYQLFEKNYRNVLNDFKAFKRIDELISGDVLISFGLQPCKGFQPILAFLRKHFIRKLERLNAENVKVMLEQNLLFKERYPFFKHGSKSAIRVEEFLVDNEIFGLLDTAGKHRIKTGIFTYNYCSEGEYKRWKEKRERESILFYC